MKQQPRTLRIIGGNWRTRKVTFPDLNDIRPTGDRVRETLFNWLMHEVAGSRCLDLFAGSGILGMEALSRGADKCIFVDSARHSVASISENLAKLGANPSSLQLECRDAMDWLSSQGSQPPDSAFDIVFLDPPFDDEDLLYTACDLLDEKQLANRWVYFESAAEPNPARLPASWQIYRQKRAGEVHYALIEVAA